MTDLGVLARWTIRPRLMGVAGVADVVIWGQRDRQLQVRVDPDQLAAKDVSLEQVISTTGNALWWSPIGRLEANTPGTGGFLDGPQQRLGILHESPIKTAEDLARVVLEPGADTSATSGSALTLGDVAEVVADHQPLIGDAVFGDGTGLLLVIEKLPEANVVGVTNGLDAAIDELAPGLAGVAVDPSVYRPARYVNDSIENVLTAVLLGLLLVVTFLTLLRGWRTALIAAVSLMTSLGASSVVLDLRGDSVNAMVLAGLVLALVVVLDDAIVVTGHIERAQHRGPSLDERGRGAGIVVDASEGVRRPIGYATVIVLLALLPIFALRSESHAFLPPIAVAFAVTVIASALVSVTLIPALSSLILSGQASAERRQPPLARWVHRASDRIARQQELNPVLPYAMIGVLALIGLGAVPFLDRPPTLVPSFRDRNLLIHWDGPSGTSLAEMERITARAADELGSIPGVQGVGAHLGRAIGGDQIVGVSSGELWVTLSASADYDSTKAAIEDVANGYPGIATEVLSASSEQVRQILGTPTHELTVRLYGDDFEVLQSKAAEVRTMLSGIGGVVDPTVESPQVEPGIEVHVDLEAAGRAGIKPGDVRRAATTLISGLAVGSLFQEQKVFDVVVVGVAQARHSLADIGNLTIDTPTGGHIRLGDVARVSVEPEVRLIRHENVSRYIDVGADVDGRGISAVAHDVESRLETISFPVGNRAVVLGDYRQRYADWLHSIAVWLAVAAGVFLVLQAAFRSWRLATLGFIGSGVALSGGVVAALAGGPMSIGTMMGFFAVFAIAVRTSMLLIGRYQDLARVEPETPHHLLIRRGTHERLAPMLLTLAGSLLVLIPFAVASDRAGYEVIHPLAGVVMGGLVSTTLFCAVVLPALYLSVAGRSSPQENADASLS